MYTQFCTTALASSSTYSELVLARNTFDVALESLSNECDYELKQIHRCRQRRPSLIEPAQAAALLPVFFSIIEALRFLGSTVYRLHKG